MLNLIRQFLRPTLREQLEAGVRQALRRYAERGAAPNLRVYVSEDLVPEGVDATLWSRDEADHLRRFAIQWAEDNSISRAGLRIEVLVLDTKREFAFVKALGVTPPEEPADHVAVRNIPQPPGPIGVGRRGLAVLETIESPGHVENVQVDGEVIVGRRSAPGVKGLDDRYMSARHARFAVDAGRLWVTDLDSKNRTFVNDEVLPPHQRTEARPGDVVRMGTTTLRVTRIGD